MARIAQERRNREYHEVKDCTFKPKVNKGVPKAVEEEVEIPSVSDIWKTANWHEREAFDLVGLKFTNHPDMKRILLPKDWEGHPLRKDYETPDFYNGMPVPKDKSYWE